jgi:hypothetical protein
MDNDATLFGRKFFRKSLFESSVDFTQRVRYAYGHDPDSVAYDPSKKDIRMSYYNIGANASLKSVTLDSLDFSYDFGIFYNYFYHIENMYQNNFGLKGEMAKSVKEFYIGSGIDFEYYKDADSLSTDSDMFLSLNPFIKKSTSIWDLKLGLQFVVDRFSDFHIYPDINFGISIIPSYVGFYAGLTGKLEKNEPLKIIAENPFLANNQYPDFVIDGILFRLPDTDHELVITAGLKGNTGLGGNYLVSASYSSINDMLFYSNLLFSDPVNPAMGNYFLPIADDVELFNMHAEMTGSFTEKLSFAWMANINNYKTGIEYAWNKPGWDGQLALKYNLRDKIIAGMELNALGKRKVVVGGDYLSVSSGYTPEIIDMATHFNMSLTGEYRYSKILSFWTKWQNITTNRYSEWAYYPSQRFLVMFGFTYSL